MKLIDLTGQRFGMLTVIEKSNRSGKRVYWRCRCDCGNTVEVLGLSLRRGATKSCGCLHSSETSTRCLSVSIGNRYGKLTVKERISPIGEKPVKWRCTCDCGGSTITTTDKLKSGKTKSCGCLRREHARKTHGMSDTRLYTIWCAMKRRCYTPGDTDYPWYGALGVTVCDEWLHDFTAFHDWAMVNGYDPDAPRGECTIDRIDPCGNYEPSNCRWVNMHVQASNKRPTRR